MKAPDLSTASTRRTARAVTLVGELTPEPTSEAPWVSGSGRCNHDRCVLSSVAIPGDDGHRDVSAEGRVLRRGLGTVRLTVGRPVEVRGLEFDAVVVVEPADFKQSMGRHGELYTSLTRANRELAIVHSKEMPRELKGRGNRVN